MNFKKILHQGLVCILIILTIFATVVISKSDSLENKLDSIIYIDEKANAVSFPITKINEIVNCDENFKYVDMNDYDPFETCRTGLSERAIANSKKYQQEQEQKRKEEEQRKVAQKKATTQTTTAVVSSGYYSFSNCYYNGYRWTYYTSRSPYLDFDGLGARVPGGIHLDSYGYWCDSQGRIILASRYHSWGTVLTTPTGRTGVVWDYCPEGAIDIATNWPL